MKDKIIEFLDLIQEKGIDASIILSENINNNEAFIIFMEENLSDEDIKEITLFLYSNSIQIADVFEYINDEIYKNSKNISEFSDTEEEFVSENKINDNLNSFEDILKKLEDISYKIDNLDDRINKVDELKFEKLNKEVEKTKDFLVDLRKSLDNEVKIYSQSLLTSVEENFKNLSNIITNLAEKFITLKTVLNNEYDLSKISKVQNSSSKNSLKFFYIFIFVSLLLLTVIFLWKIFIK